MRKLLALLVLFGAGAVLYTIFSDPVRREKILSTIEGSTGVDLGEDPPAVARDAGRAIGEATEKALKELGRTLSDPRLRRSIEKWGRDAFNSLDETELKGFQRDIERALEGESDVDEVFRRYLGDPGDS